MIAAGRSDIGLKRDTNQDFYFVSKDSTLPLYILADGMGGEKGGEIASRLAIETSREIFENNRFKLQDEKTIKEIIREAIERSNTKIHKKSLKDKNLEGMGTTLLIVYISKDRLYIGHVGDSRLYYITAESIEQLTEDHSLVNALVKSGQLSLEEAKKHPQKNMITRAVGAAAIVESDILSYDYIKKDKILLCSDGLSNMLEDKKIYNIMNSSENIDEICDNLISEALKLGGNDNITTVVVKL